MKKSLVYPLVTQHLTGLARHEVSLGLTRFRSGPMRSVLGNAQQTELAFQATRSATLAASNHLLTSRTAAILFEETARTFLKTFLGERWSTKWTQAGFINRTLTLPENTSGVLSLLRAMQSYLIGHPGHQNAAANVLPPTAGGHVTTLDAAVTALNTAKCNQWAGREARDAADKTLTLDWAGSRTEVGLALPENDARWLDFRGSVPADLRAPEAVSVLDARPGLPGHVSRHWLDSVRAERFEIEAAVGESTEFAHITVVRDTVADLTFAPGTAVRLRVNARNAAGQSSPSPVVTSMVPKEEAA